MLLAITDEIRERSYESPDILVESLLQWGFVLLVAYFGFQLLRGIVEDWGSGGPQRRRVQRRNEEEAAAASRKERERRATSPDPHEAKLDLVNLRIEVEYLSRTLRQVKKRWGSVDRAPAYVRNGLEYQEKKLPDKLRQIQFLAQCVSQHESKHGSISATPDIMREFHWACQMRAKFADELRRYREQSVGRDGFDEWACESAASRARDRANAIREAFQISDEFESPLSPD